MLKYSQPFTIKEATMHTLFFKPKSNTQISCIQNGEKLSPLPPAYMHTVQKTSTQTNHTLTIKKLTKQETGTYEVVAINNAGEARCEANVTIDGTLTKPQEKTEQKQNELPVLEKMQDVICNEGDSAEFRVQFKGDGIATWFREEALIPNNDEFVVSYLYSELFFRLLRNSCLIKNNFHTDGDNREHGDPDYKRNL